MQTYIKSSRQATLNHIVAEALQNSHIREAMQTFQMGDYEYARAIAGTINVMIITSDTSTSEVENHVELDSD